MPGQLSWNKAFFVHRRLTSKLKHLILQRYVKEFAYHLGSAHSTVYYVDGFAGRGEYRNPGGNVENGSPLLIAELARKILASHANFRMKCLNVEENRRNYGELETATEKYRPQIVENNYHGKFVEAIPSILSVLDSSPAFIFIDPWGTKGIPFINLLPLFKRTPRTEVFITLHTDGIAKKAGYFSWVDDSSPKRSRLGRKITEILAAALHLDWQVLRTWWFECVSQDQGGTAAFEERVLRHYLNILREPTTRFSYTKAFPIFYYRSDEPPDSTTPICFYLVFATQHKKGLYEMNDAMSDALDTFYHEEYGQTLFPLFREQLDKTKDETELAFKIIHSFKSKPFTIDEVKQHLMQEITLLIKQSRYRNAVIALYMGKKLRKLTAGSITNEQTKFEVAVDEAPGQPGLLFS